MVEIQTDCFDEEKIKKELKSCSKDLQNYVKKLWESNERRKSITNQALRKIKELS